MLYRVRDVPHCNNGLRKIKKIKIQLFCSVVFIELKHIGMYVAIVSVTFSWFILVLLV